MRTNIARSGTARSGATKSGCMKAALVTAALAVSLVACSAATSATGSAQERRARADLYLCEGCEAVHERDPASLDWRTRIADDNEPGDRMVVRGTVYETDGVTRAAGVVIYMHQTNAAGAYAGGSSESEWSRRHGRLRGWTKTDRSGRYEFATVKPAPYPGHDEPAHVHLTVLESGRRPYYIDDVVFADEYRVDAEYRRSREERGGLGVVSLAHAPDGTWIAERDIVLESHPE